MARGGIERGLEALARAMRSSRETVASSKSSASRGRLVAVCGPVADGRRVREEDEKAGLLRQARSPAVRSVGGRDLSEVMFPEGHTKDDLVGLGLLGLARGFAFYGGCGRGKARLATAVGPLATQAGHRARHLETAALVPMPKEAAADGRPGQAPKDVRGADLPIIDELGHLPAGVGGARLPCQVMAATYESRSMIVTTDAGSGRRGTVPGDDEPATAAVDRVARHGRLVESGGSSRRFDEALMMGKSERWEGVAAPRPLCGSG